MTKKILIIDDEKNIRLMLDQALSTAGYAVATAIDGEHGLDKVKESHFDVLLLDMKLPGMDGIEVLRRARALRSDLPVIMITAHGTVETAVEAMKVGAIDYLRKPFTPDEIRSIVGKVLRRQTLPTDHPAADLDTCLELAKLHLSRREFDEAARLLQQANQLAPANAEVLNLLGVYHELLGHLQEAGRHYRAALSFQPAYTPASHNLSRTVNWPYSPAGIDKSLEPNGPQEDR